MKRIFSLMVCMGILHAQCPPANSNDATNFTTQTEVNSFFNYPNCTEFPRHLSLGYSAIDPIVDLSPLNNLIEINGSLNILNTNLVSLGGLENVDIISYLRISDNQLLESFDGLNNLRRTVLLEIKRNPLITSMDGLNNLQTVLQQITIEENPQLLSFNGLDKLAEVGQGGFFITGNEKLLSLEGLVNLTNLKHLDVRNNDVLQTLQGIENANPDDINTIRLLDNNNLFLCHLPNICAYITMGGYTQIQNNLGDCETRNNVINTCELMTTHHYNDLKIDIYTKNNTLYIKSPIMIQDIIVYDLSGKIIHQKNTINSDLYQTSFLPSQPLIVKIKTVDGKVTIQKIIINNK